MNWMGNVENLFGFISISCFVDNDIDKLVGSGTHLRFDGAARDEVATGNWDEDRLLR